MTRGSEGSARIAIIGGGFGGIAAAVKLQQRGIEDFTIFEAGEHPGGTWWHNRYPGCEVDIPSLCYSFSFMDYDWPSTHGSRDDLLAYTDAVVERFDLLPRFRLGTRVASAEWQDQDGEWLVTLPDGSAERFRFVISALGLLSNPKHPDWPGLEDFGGIAFHTSDWDRAPDLAGKRVAVVGTGSTAVQVVPGIAEDAGHVTVFQRQPGWVLPKGERPYTDEERERYRRSPLRFRIDRWKAFHGAFKNAKMWQSGTQANADTQAACRGYIEATIEDAATRAAVTPDYAWGCKRPVFSTTFYPTLNRQNVSLVPKAVASVTERGLVDADGEEHPVDVIVMSTGFQPTSFLSTLAVRGAGGRDIQDAWGDRPTAYLGITVPGFPNFFILYGPNTNGGFAITSMLERQAEVAVRRIRRAIRKNAIVDTSERATARWTAWVERQIDERMSAGNDPGCTNYYHSESGANVTQWPLSAFQYWRVTRFPAPGAFRYRPR
ncbi:MAG TPA: NAD(P)/FAD-dependent oxidoreductase [Microbacteriaceae bacterium]|nr:NAD(P)/FAD-dependent oxidoreductase [Microbacteriaceae bacterium]